MKQIFFLCALLFFSCDTPQNPTTFTGHTMEMDYLIHVGKKLDKNERNEVEKIIATVFSEIKQTFSTYEEGSEITQLNKLSSGERVKISSEMEKVLEIADRIVKLSDGRFDPTIAPLAKLWHGELEKGKLPATAELEKARSKVGWHHLEFGSGYFEKDLDGVQMDLGGVAKGYCIDLLIEKLPYNNLFVSWGGEVRTQGIHPENRPWSIYITRLSDPNPKNAIAFVGLHDEAIATSGDYLQIWRIEDEAGKIRHFSHIIDPKKGAPIELESGKISSVSMTAPTCAVADSLATAAMLFQDSTTLKLWAKELEKEFPNLRMWVISR